MTSSRYHPIFFLTIATVVIIWARSASGQVPVTNGLILHLDAQDPNGNGSPVSHQDNIESWVDKSGMGNDVTAPVASPRYNTVDTINGNNVVSFEAGFNALQKINVNGLGTGDQPFTAFVVMRATQVQGNERIFDLLSVPPPISSSGNRNGFWYGPNVPNGTPRFGVWFGQERQHDTFAWNSEPNVLEVSYQGSQNIKGYFNGVLDLDANFDGTFDGFSNTPALTLGQHFGYNTFENDPNQSILDQAGTYYNGVLGDFVMFNRVLTDEERGEVGDFLGDKYGIPTSYIAECMTAACAWNSEASGDWHLRKNWEPSKFPTRRRNQPSWAARLLSLAPSSRTSTSRSIVSSSIIRIPTPWPAGAT